MLLRTLDTMALKADTEEHCPGRLLLVATNRTDTPLGVGSVYRGITDPKYILEVLLSHNWKWMEKESRASGNSDFWRAPMAGLSGAWRLGDLPPETEVSIRETGGRLMRVVIPGAERTPVQYSTLVTFRRYGRDILTTFHPGDPLEGVFRIANQFAGHTMPVRQAMQLGFKYGLAGRHLNPSIVAEKLAA